MPFFLVIIAFTFFVLSVGVWELATGKILGRYGKVYTRQRNPVIFWARIASIFLGLAASAAFWAWVLLTRLRGR
jgi:hypothetical protein